MAWTVIWTDRALKDAERLGRRARERVVAAVERLATTEYGDVKRLRGVQPPTWRLRVGPNRVLFTYDYGARELHVRGVASRGRAYRD